MNVIFFLYLGIISHLTFKWKIQVHINHTHPLKFIRCCNILLSLFVGTLCFRFFHAAENFLEYAITNNRLFQTTFQILLILTSIESKYKTHCFKISIRLTVFKSLSEIHFVYRYIIPFMQKN